jgi:AraC-like DNA-binding protein
MYTNSSATYLPASADPLSEILRDLRPSGVSYGHCRLTRPWGVEIPQEPLTRFHLLVAGEAWLRHENADPIQLTAGDVVLFPNGGSHFITDTPRGRTRPLSSFPVEEIGELTYRLVAGGGGPQTLMACCTVHFDEPAAHILLELMPPIIVVRRAAIEDSALPALLDAMAEEVMAQRVGNATMLSRLADVVVIRLIRRWAETRGNETFGWLAAVRDPRIGKALIAIHQRPEKPWSVESLARVASLSRSMFSERFASVLGMPPAKYLATWRMSLARHLLGRQRLTVSEVATRLGYDSEPSFSRAFKRVVGVPPGSLRRSDALRPNRLSGAE